MASRDLVIGICHEIIKNKGKAFTSDRLEVAKNMCRNLENIDNEVGSQEENILQFNNTFHSFMLEFSANEYEANRLAEGLSVGGNKAICYQIINTALTLYLSELTDGGVQSNREVQIAQVKNDVTKHLEGYLKGSHANYNNKDLNDMIDSLAAEAKKTGPVNQATEDPIMQKFTNAFSSLLLANPQLAKDDLVEEFFTFTSPPLVNEDRGQYMLEAMSVAGHADIPADHAE